MAEQVNNYRPHTGAEEAMSIEDQGLHKGVEAIPLSFKHDSDKVQWAFYFAVVFINNNGGGDKIQVFGSTFRCAS